jgi:hypothetical protein
MHTRALDIPQVASVKPFWPPLAVATIVMACSLLIVLQPFEFLVRHLKDDSFYYLKTANNIALGLGSTFDGINRTNGYHPLWMLNLVPIYWLLPHSPLDALRVVMILIAIYHTIAAVILYYLVSRLHNEIVGMIVGLAWALSPFVLRIDLNGMESALYALLLLLLTYRITIFFKDSAGRWKLRIEKKRSLLVLGMLVALCMLARLDAVFLCAAILISSGFATVRSHGLHKNIAVMGLFSAPICLLVGSYLLYNLISFGHLNTISGLIKSPAFPIPIQEFFMRLLWPIAPIYTRTGIVAAFSVLAVAFAIVLASLVMSRSLRTFTRLIWRRYDWLWIGALLLYAYISVSQTYIFNWYYVPMILLFTLIFADVLGIFIQSFKPNTIKITLAWMSASLVALYILIAASEFNARKNDTAYEAFHASVWIKKHLPENAIGAAWNAGVISYFSDRQIINLDGLINSYAYYDAMKRGEEPEFVINQHVAYVFDMYPVPASGNSGDFFPDGRWRRFLEPYYEYRYEAHNVGISSYFKTVFPTPEHDALFMFKVWKIVPPNNT